MTSAECIYRI